MYGPMTFAQMNQYEAQLYGVSDLTSPRLNLLGYHIQRLTHLYLSLSRDIEIFLTKNEILDFISRHFLTHCRALGFSTS